MLAVGAVPLVALTCPILPRFAFHGNSEVVQVNAAEGWQSTGIHVRPGDRLTISYLDGYWSPWPGEEFDAIGSGGDPRCRCNVMEGVSHAALLGRIGKASPFLVGSEFQQVVGKSGVVLLGINDVDLDDNSGKLRVLVEIER
jgi:hypothetical protein